MELAFSKKKVLVTGGGGFLGSHLCDMLLKEGHEVIGLDNFQTGSPDNLVAHLRNPNFRLIEADVARPIDLAVDEIYNLACPASPVHYRASPVTTMRTGLLGAMSVLELAAATGARVLQASTSEIYGDPLMHPQTENYLGNTNCFGERACYDESKRAAEALFYSYAQEKSVDIRIARIFNTYGPRMQINDGRVVCNFIVQALRNQPLTLYGDGSQTRSFCYVDDLVRGLVRLMKSEVTTPVNLGNPGEFTVGELADLIISMTGSSSEKQFLPLPDDDPTRRRPSIDKARTLLNWTPAISLRAGLVPTIDYFRARLDVGMPIYMEPAAEAPITECRTAW